MMAKMFVLMILLSSSFLDSYALAIANSTELHTAKIARLTGYQGHYNSNNDSNNNLDNKTYKIIVPRDDLEISMRGMQITPDMGLFSWVEFEKTGDVTAVRGDLLLLPDQVNPVMSVALMNGLQVTGLNNPYLWDSPRVTLMHLKGEGNEFQLAKGIGQIFNKIKMTQDGSGDFPLGTSDLIRTTLNSSKIDAILGTHGHFKEGVYRVGLSAKTKAIDESIDKEIAKNSWVAFSGSDNEAVVNGSLVVREPELQKTLLKLRQAKIYILAIYPHRAENTEGYVSISVWGIGGTKKLASALHEVFLLAQNTTSKQPSSLIAPIKPNIADFNQCKMPIFQNNNNNNSLNNVFLSTAQNPDLKDTGELRLKIFTLLGLAQATASEEIEALANVLSNSIKKLPWKKTADNGNSKNSEEFHLKMFSFGGLTQATAAEQIEALANVFPLDKTLSLVAELSSELSSVKNSVF